MSFISKIECNYVLANKKEYCSSFYEGKKGDKADFLLGRALRIADYLGKWDEVLKKMISLNTLKEQEDFVIQLIEDLDDQTSEKIAQEIKKGWFGPMAHIRKSLKLKVAGEKLILPAT